MDLALAFALPAVAILGTALLFPAGLGVAAFPPLLRPRWDTLETDNCNMEASIDLVFFFLGAAIAAADDEGSDSSLSGDVAYVARSYI